MGAQQSAGYNRNVKLRRRSGTAGQVTSEELNEAGVDLAKAVAAITMMQQQGEMGKSDAPMAKVGGTQGLSAARQPAPRGTIEMPPWEVVAQLGESDWVALRAWIDAGWR